MLLRAFNGAGTERFREYLAACREKPAMAPPRDLLEDDNLSSIVRGEIFVEEKSFNVRADAAHHFRELLQGLPDHEVANNSGLWTWLTLYYFDQVCPASSGKREVKNDYYYIFEPDNPRHFYRHLLYIGWRVLMVAPEHNRLFLNVPLNHLDEFTVLTMKRLFITRIPCVFEVLDRLYWDDARGRARPGVVGTNSVKPGDLTHRLPMRIRQLEKTYDLYSLNADQMIELLGDEFAREGVTLSLPSVK